MFNLLEVRFASDINCKSFLTRAPHIFAQHCIVDVIAHLASTTDLQEQMYYLSQLSSIHILVRIFERLFTDVTVCRMMVNSHNSQPFK